MGAVLGEVRNTTAMMAKACAPHADRKPLLTFRPQLMSQRHACCLDGSDIGLGLFEGGTEELVQSLGVWSDT